MAHAVTLGDGLDVSRLGFGGMALTPVYGEVDQEDALRTLHHAVDSGVTFIDTADIYGGGSNEELIARLLRERRDDVQLATKFALVGTPADGYTDIRAQLDEVWFVDVPPALRLNRLVERHISFGMERAAAEAWAGGPDQANAVLIEATRPAASRIIPWH